MYTKSELVMNPKMMKESLMTDEEITVGHEDTIIVLVLALLHPELPLFVRDIYTEKILDNKRLMDFKDNIFKDADLFLSKSLNEDEDLILSEEHDFKEDVSIDKVVYYLCQFFKL